jgi:hypothetical protein
MSGQVESFEDRHDYRKEWLSMSGVSKCVALVGLATMTICFVSCGRKAGPVVCPAKGKVLYRGKPAEGALVTLIPLEKEKANARRPGATVQSDGTFRLSTYASFDGAPPGRYAVIVIYHSPEKTVDDENVGPDLLKGRYADPATTPLNVEVKEGSNELEPFTFQ